jgi:hypothetical protein
MWIALILAALYFSASALVFYEGEGWRFDGLREFALNIAVCLFWPPVALFALVVLLRNA